MGTESGVNPSMMNRHFRQAVTIATCPGNASHCPPQGDSIMEWQSTPELSLVVPCRRRRRRQHLRLEDPHARLTPAPSLPRRDTGKRTSSRHSRCSRPWPASLDPQVPAHEAEDNIEIHALGRANPGESQPPSPPYMPWQSRKAAGLVSGISRTPRETHSESRHPTPRTSRQLRPGRPRSAR